MELPVINMELAERIQQVEIDYLTSRIRSIGERLGNPEGVEIHRFGKTTAFYIRTMPWGLFNSVKGLSDDDADLLDDIILYYQTRNRAFQFDVDPIHCSPKLFKRLAERGFYQNGFHSVLYGLPADKTPIHPSYIHIIEVKNESEFDHYAEIHCLGSGMSLADKHHFVNNNKGILNREGWKIFLAYLDGTPAGVAVMHISGNIASCTLAATHPNYRNRGLQTALLQHRMHEAHKADCTLVAAQASFGSTSQNNMERAGMQLAWTRSIWVK
ncbi:GNAT superfamily N-acetyltransferase [Paenibacillus castaneae]|uniref:GNAT family N-acetyltransferase n=1 Tax=Paenibacillus castaneae TaxID=474957 RepID=UPI000C9D119B|nr:GNAT family N-acetyltransferase [Paenibacillus castaneae]NIK76775.1 GNAT superfamily N-acetyltransferase [Paenibacillus castaneae]